MLMSRNRALLLVYLLLSTVPFSVLGQKPSSQSAGQNSSSAPTASPASSTGGGAGSASLPGLSYARADWNQISAMPSPYAFGFSTTNIGSFFWDDLQGHSFRKDVILYCFTVIPNTSATAPYVLEPTPLNEIESRLTDEEKKPERAKSTPQGQGSNSPPSYNPKKNPELCANQIHTPYRASSLLMGRYLVFRIDMSKVLDRSRIETLNLNVTASPSTSFNAQRLTSLNPSLQRPRLALLSGPKFPCVEGEPPGFKGYSVAGSKAYDAFCPGPNHTDHVDDPSVVYIAWPVPLVADTIPDININLIYTPVAPALPWKGNTFYPAGSIVISTSISGNGEPTTNGHYYFAVSGGRSDPANPPDFERAATAVEAVEDGRRGLEWRLAGTLCQSPGGSPQGAGAGTAKPTTTAAPPIVGLSTWQPGTQYPVGALVVPAGPGNCHYYQATTAGQSGDSNHPPVFPINGGGVSEQKANPDGTKLTWKDMGTFSVPAWQANTGYARGTLVAAPSSTGYFYEAITTGVSGPNQPAFPLIPVAGSAGAPFNPHKKNIVAESEGLIWLDVGSGASPPASIKTLKVWSPKTAYMLGDGIFDRDTGHYYLAIAAGVSGNQLPDFSVPAPLVAAVTSANNQQIEWEDLGTTLPTGVTAGTQPADQTVNVVNLNLPQVHSVTWFNLASGVVVSSLRTVSVSSSAATSGCPNSATNCTAYTSTPGSKLVDPVLGLTVYAFHPVDVEQPFRLQDLTPEPVFNLSLSSPTGNFHLGLASEFFVRNLQFVYGVSLVQETRLVPPAGGATVSTATTKKFSKGGFAGFTLDLTGLINAVSGVIP